MILPVLILLTYLPSFKILAYAAYVGAVFLAVAMIVSGTDSIGLIDSRRCAIDNFFKGI